MSDRSEVREPEGTYDASPRPRGRPRTLDYSVFESLNVDPMALVQAGQIRRESRFLRASYPWMVFWDM